MQDYQKEQQKEQFRTVVNGYRLYGVLNQNQQRQFLFSLHIQPNHDKTFNYALNFTDKNLNLFGFDQTFPSVKVLYEHLSKMTKTKVKFDSKSHTFFILHQNKKTLKSFPINLSQIPNFQETKNAQKQQQANDIFANKVKARSFGLQGKQIFVSAQCSAQQEILHEKQLSETIAESISGKSLTQHENHLQTQQFDKQTTDIIQSQKYKKDEITSRELNIGQAEKLQQQLRKCLGCKKERTTPQRDNIYLQEQHHYEFEKKQHQNIDLYWFSIQFKVDKLVETIQNGQIDKLPEIILKRVKLLEIPPLNQIFLGNLIHLSLQENNIGKIENLDSIPNLERLNLEANSIKVIENLGNLKNLRFLKLGNNKIQRIQGLQNLANLQVLWLDFNSIHKIEGLTTLHRLKSLNLSFNEISRLQGFEGLTRLQELLLNENQLTQIQNLMPLSKLTRLSINSNFITQIRGLKKLLLLQMIHLTGNAIESFDRPAFDEINWLKMLKQIRLNANQIQWHDQSLKFIERLQNYGVKVKI